MNASTEPRAIPTQMWNEIAHVDEIASSAIARELQTTREAITRIGAKYGFTAAELTARGILSPEPKPKPGAPKGSRRG